MESELKNIEDIYDYLAEDVNVSKVIHHENSIELVVSYREPTSKEVKCPHCLGSHCVFKDSGQNQTIRHIKLDGENSLITFHKPRFLCKECGRSFYFKPDWVCPNISISEALCRQIIELLTSTSHSLAEIARETGATAYIVSAVMINCKVERSGFLLETISVDELRKW